MQIPGPKETTNLGYLGIRFLPPKNSFLSLLSGSMLVTGRQKMIETIQKEQIQASKGR